MNKDYESSVQDDMQQEKTTKERRLFVYDSFNINYENTSQIQEVAHESGKDVQVENYLCIQDGNTLYKMTQIYFQGKVIRIEDKFEVNAEHDSPKNIGNRVSDKIRIFYHDPLEKFERNGKPEKKDKKNIVKNIVKIFVSWLQKKKKDSKMKEYIIAEAQIKTLLEKQNFNNRLIKSIISNEKINKPFLKFLVNDAQEEVKYSRIHDKESHYEALKLYKRLLSEENELPKRPQNTRTNQINDMEAKIEEQK